MKHHIGRCRGLKRLAIVAFVLIFLIISTSSVYATETKSAETVKVGYIDYENFIETNSSGDYYGYGVDYMNKIASHTGWNVEYVYDSWSNQLENLKNGTIDFLIQAQKTHTLWVRNQAFSMSPKMIYAIITTIITLLME